MSYTNHRRDTPTTPRSGRDSVSPYLLEDVGLTAADLVRDRAVTIVQHHQ